MQIARSSDARSKIRQWLKKNRRDEVVALGRSAFEWELKQFGLRLRDVTSPEILTVLLRNTSYNSLEDLYAAIGCGGFTAQKAVMRIEGELSRSRRQKTVQEQEQEKTPPVRKEPPKQVHSEQGVIVEGVGNCLVRFSRCCMPVPGDAITGFVTTRGKGISVHRADCPNASGERQNKAPGRWVKVSWGERVNENYPTALEAVCKDRDNLARDITAALSDLKTCLRGVSIRATEDDFALCRLDLRVRNLDELNHVMNKLHQVSGVLRVSRPGE